MSVTSETTALLGYGAGGVPLTRTPDPPHTSARSVFEAPESSPMLQRVGSPAFCFNIPSQDV